MLTRCLNFTNKFFASQFTLLKQGYLIPTPPKRPLTEQAILVNLLRKDGLLKGKQLKNALEEENYAVEQKKQAKIQREQLVKEYLQQKQAYENTFTYPSKINSTFTFFVKEQYADKNNAIVGKPTELMKVFSQKFQALAQNEKAIYEQKLKEANEKYQNEVKQFEERNKQWKVPNHYQTNAYTLYVKQEFAKNPKLTLTEVSQNWKNVPEEQKNALHAQAEEINKKIKEDVLKFLQDNKISEEEFKEVFKRKPKTPSKTD